MSTKYAALCDIGRHARSRGPSCVCYRTDQQEGLTLHSQGKRSHNACRLQSMHAATRLAAADLGLVCWALLFLTDFLLTPAADADVSQVLLPVQR